MKSIKGKGKMANERINATFYTIHHLRYAIRQTLYATLILACLVSLSGCWDLVEVDRRTFVTTIGIDTGNNGDTSVIVQIPLPERMLPSSISLR